ncbi:hypothetical protein E4U43_005443 [Claviceps pusilla]|uniref:Uncharacterized protein n=1 Tax=Claviceps pusilla TaxID=123648 RepID=A0A9P7NEE6_9HYPO|nr:hypothetical protein E4U43_005443 [Claviceps pusilla]
MSMTHSNVEQADDEADLAVMEDAGAAGSDDSRGSGQGASGMRPGCVQGGVQSQDLQMRSKSHPNMANQSIGIAK